MPRPLATVPARYVTQPTTPITVAQFYSGFMVAINNTPSLNCRSIEEIWLFLARRRVYYGVAINYSLPPTQQPELIDL